jgi:hypothetical protein
MEERLHVLTNRWATFVSENKVLLFVRRAALNALCDVLQALRADIEEDRKDHVCCPSSTTVNPF